MYLVCGFVLFDSYQCLGNGILRGIGRQTYGVPAVLIGGWICGLPLSALLCFYFNYGFIGIWYGLCIGYIIMDICLFIAFSTYKFNYYLCP